MEEKKRISITFTLLIWTGILLIIVGLFFITFDIKASQSYFELDYGEFTIKTFHLGLVLIFIGAILSFLITKNLPKNTTVLGDNTRANRVEILKKRILIPSLLIALSSFITLLITLYNG